MTGGNVGHCQYVLSQLIQLLYPTGSVCEGKRIHKYCSKRILSHLILKNSINRRRTMHYWQDQLRLFLLNEWQSFRLSHCPRIQVVYVISFYTNAKLRTLKITVYIGEIW